MERTGKKPGDFHMDPYVLHWEREESPLCWHTRRNQAGELDNDERSIPCRGKAVCKGLVGKLMLDYGAVVVGRV